jgi:hypothetical protein
MTREGQAMLNRGEGSAKETKVKMQGAVEVVPTVLKGKEK